ncbi:MAG: ankyrin repeat domain-containing protein [Planctomycetes bacterium]|nr:ankyrin repeat domain-containing protein [Planctomycetota bacterium]
MRKFILACVLFGMLFVFTACEDVDQPVEPTAQPKASDEAGLVKAVETEPAAPKPPVKKVKPATDEFFDNAMKGNTQAVEKALLDGVDVNSQNSDKRTALMFAAFDGHLSTVELLLTRGADVNLKDAIGRDALMYAASGPNNTTVKLLLQKGADVNAADTNEKWTALMYAAAEGQMEVVKTLLENKADWTIKDIDGDTAKSFAVKNGHTKVVELIDNFVKTKTGAR